MTSQPHHSGTPAKEGFLSIPIAHLFPDAFEGFEIFIRRGNRHTLFAKSGERFTAGHRSWLKDQGVEEVYIRGEEQRRFKSYLRRNLGAALLGEDLDKTEKAAVFYRHSMDIVRGLVTQKLPLGISGKHRKHFFAFVGKSVATLTTDAGLKRIASLMSHDYDVYSHSVHVFVYAAFLMKSAGLDEDTIVQSGVGALLHDAGKEYIDAAILNKPGPLDTDEWKAVKKHPALGANLCRPLALSRTALETILMHHEKIDGTGYPQGLFGDDIPLHVRAVTMADVYDALTTKRVYADAVKPFEALRIMRDEMNGSFDMDLYKQFIYLLSGAELL